MEIGEAKNITKGITPVKAVHLGQQLVWPKTKGIYIPFDKLPIANEGYTDGESVNITIGETANPSLATIDNTTWTKIAGGGLQRNNGIIIRSPYLKNICSENWELKFSIQLEHVQNTETIFSIIRTFTNGNISSYEETLHLMITTNTGASYRLHFVSRNREFLTFYDYEYDSINVTITYWADIGNFKYSDNISGGGYSGIRLCDGTLPSQNEGNYMAFPGTYMGKYIKDLKFYYI